MVRPLGRLCPDPQPATCWGVERWAAPMTLVCAYPTQANGRLEWATRRFWVFRSAKFSVGRPPAFLTYFKCRVTLRSSYPMSQTRDMGHPHLLGGERWGLRDDVSLCLSHSSQQRA